jgi:hypothetical protein
MKRVVIVVASLFFGYYSLRFTIRSRFEQDLSQTF